MAETKAGPARPLSPHLQIYRFTLLMAASILHRITGGALYFGMLMLAWWLVALASGPQAYAWFAWFAGSPLGLLILFGFTLALMQHAMGGIRHLIWDTGYGLEVTKAQRIAAVGLGASVVLTVLVWLVAFAMR